MYAVVTWLVIQVADTAFPHLMLPEWSVRLVIVLSILGLPIAALLAWAFEMTPAGIHREEPLVPAESVAFPAASPLGARAGMIALGALLIGGSGYFGYGYLSEARGADLRSIAVLPFENLSDSRENAYFSDGIHEDILTHLSKIGELRVISRTSVMPYRDTDKSVRQIGEELGVAVLLEGSVRRSGDRVRISAQLIDARTDRHLWAETYDRDLKDLFTVQSEIAGSIATSLRAQLTPAEKQRIEAKPTESLTAYDLYLRGRDYYNRYKKADNEIAADFFKRAIQADPSFALAYAGLADAYGQKTTRFGGAYAWADSSIAVARKAVSLNPSLAEAHKALGTAYATRGWGSKSLEPYQRAIALNPNYTPAIHNLGVLHWRAGRFDESLRYARKAMALNPTSASTVNGLAITYISLGLYRQAEEMLGRALALQPDLPQAQMDAIRLALARGNDAEARERSERLVSQNAEDAGARLTAGEAYVFSGDYRRARELFQEAYAMAPQIRWEWGHSAPVLLGYTLWRAGEREKAQSLFADFEVFAHDELKRGNEAPDLHHSLAAVHAIRGERQEALRWLREAIASGWMNERHLARDPLLESLREEPEFQRMLAQMRAELERQRSVVEREGL